MEKGEGRGEGGKVCCLITKLIVLLFSDGEGHMEKSPSLSEVRRIGGVHPILFPRPSSRSLSPFSSPPPMHTG